MLYDMFALCCVLSALANMKTISAAHEESANEGQSEVGVFVLFGLLALFHFAASSGTEDCPLCPPHKAYDLAV